MNNEEVNKKKNRKEKKKMGKIELGFTIFSLIFLIGFSCFYGYRLFYYKNKLSPKKNDGTFVTLLSNKIKENVVTSGDGLYNEDSNFIFKGQNVNNYIMYSNMLFRIIKINKDNTIELILDDTLNTMSYDNEKINYNESDLRKYLNDIFYKNIKSDLLVKSPYCIDKIENIGKFNCTNIKVDYVKLLSISDYFNSRNNDISYLDSENIIWLNNNNDDSVWLLNNGNLSLVKPNELYQVKPIITLNNFTVFKSGEGSIEKPYIIENDKSYYASYIKLDEDIYRVYDVKDDILKLQSEYIYKDGNIKYHFSNNDKYYSTTENLGLYLNTTIYNELSYKDLLEDCDFYIGKYNSSYENILKDTIKAKVGIPNIIDPIFNKNKNNYYFSTIKDDGNVYIYNDDVYGVKPNIVRNISLSVCINKNKITSGNGTLDEPYVVLSEVQK